MHRAAAAGKLACHSRSAFRLLKLLLCCCVVAEVLEWCSSTAARWPVAVLVVVGLRLLADHVDVRRRLSRPPQLASSRRAATVAATTAEADEQSRESQAKQSKTPGSARLRRDHDAWRRSVGSELVAKTWDKLCNSIIQEFIYEAWFGSLSPDCEFPAEVRWQLNHAFGQASRRAKRLDWTSLLVRDCSAAVGSALQLYRTAADMLGPDTLRTLPAADADAAIRHVLSTEHMLHPAFSRPGGQYLACKQLSEAVLVHIMPPEDRACPMLRAMLRELFATCLLRSTLASLAPYSINKLLLNILDGGARQQDITQDMACAAAEFEQKGYNSSRAEQEHISRQTCEHRSQESELGALNMAQESSARAAVAFKSSMKRSKSLGDVKEGAGSKSPGRAAAAAAAAACATVWPGGSSTMVKTFSRWRDSPNSSPIRNATSSSQPAGQQGAQAVLGSMGAVKAAAQQLSLRRRLGSDARLGAGTTARGTSPPSSSVGTDSPRSCVSAFELSSSPDPVAGYRIAAAAAAARAMSTGGFSAAWAGSEATSSNGYRSTAVSSIGGSGCSTRSPMVAALCNLSKTPRSTISSQSGAAPATLLVQPGGKLRAQVVSADMLNLDGKDCIVYKVCASDHRGEWTVTRRYRHFETLHKRLKEAPHYRDLPASLPPKRLLTARDAPFVVRRRDELDCYLQALLRSSFLCSHRELVQFLDQQSQLYSMAAAADELQGIRPAGDVGLLSQRSRSDDAGGLDSWRGRTDGSDRLQQVSSVSYCNSSTAWQAQPQQLEQESSRACSSSTGGNSATSSGSISGLPSTELQADSRALLPCSTGAAAQTYVSEDRQALADTRATTGSGQEQRISEHSIDNLLSEQQQALCVQQGAVAGGQPCVDPQQDSRAGMLSRGLQQQQANVAAPTQSTHSSCRSSSRGHGLDAASAYIQQTSAVQVPQQVQHWRPAQLLQGADSVHPSCLEQQATAVPQLPSSPPVSNKASPERSPRVQGASFLRTPGTPRQLSKQELDAAHATYQIDEQQHWSSSKHSPIGAPTAADIGRRARGAVDAAVHFRPDVAPASRSSSMPPSSSQLGMTAAAAAAAAARKAAADAGHALDSSSSRKPYQSGVLKAQQPRLARSAAGGTAVSSKLDNAARLAAAGRIDSSGAERQGLPQVQLNAAKWPAPAQGAAARCSPPDDLQRIQDLSHQEAHGTAAGLLLGVQPMQVPQQGSSSSADSTQKGRASESHSGEASSPGDSSGQLWLQETVDWQDCAQDSTGLIVPLYDLVSCAFELQTKGFVRRPVITLVRQLLSLVAGGAIDEFLQKALANGLSEESISRQITRLQAQLWPGGIWFARAAAAAAGSVPSKGPSITAEHYLDWTPPADSEEVAEQLRQRLLASTVPAPLLALLGINAYIKCMGDIYGVMQSKTLMYHLGLTLVEILLVAMFPEIKGSVQAMHQASNV